MRCARYGQYWCWAEVGLFFRENPEMRRTPQTQPSQFSPKSYEVVICQLREPCFTLSLSLWPSCKSYPLFKDLVQESAPLDIFPAYSNLLSHHILEPCHLLYRTIGSIG